MDYAEYKAYIRELYDPSRKLPPTSKLFKGLRSSLSEYARRRDGSAHIGVSMLEAEARAAQRRHREYNVGRPQRDHLVTNLKKLKRVLQGAPGRLIMANGQFRPVNLVLEEGEDWSGDDWKKDPVKVAAWNRICDTNGWPDKVVTMEDGSTPFNHPDTPKLKVKTGTAIDDPEAEWTEVEAWVPRSAPS